MKERERDRERPWKSAAPWLVIAGVLSAVVGCAGADYSAQPAATGQPLRLEIAPLVGGGPIQRGR